MDNLHPVHQHQDGFFNTISGKKISLHEPTADMIEISDIAHGLSNVCRFGGHTKHHYSVAQHSVLVMHLAPQHLKFAALLHDATEAYLGDVIKPLKNILGDVYTNIEKKFEEAICRRFGIDINILQQIKPYDKEALEIEHEYFFKGNQTKFIHAFGSYYYWSSQHASREYLDWFYSLFGYEDWFNPYCSLCGKPDCTGTCKREKEVQHG